MTIGAVVAEWERTRGGESGRVGERLDESGYSAWFQWRLGRARIFIDVNNAARGREGWGVRSVVGGGLWMWDELRDGILALKRGWTLSTRVDLNAWHASAPNAVAAACDICRLGVATLSLLTLLQTSDKHRAEENYLIFSPFSFSCIFLVFPFCVPHWVVKFSTRLIIQMPRQFGWLFAGLMTWLGWVLRGGLPEREHTNTHTHTHQRDSGRASIANGSATASCLPFSAKFVYCGTWAEVASSSSRHSRVE